MSAALPAVDVAAATAAGSISPATSSTRCGLWADRPEKAVALALQAQAVSSPWRQLARPPPPPPPSSSSSSASTASAGVGVLAAMVCSLCDDVLDVHTPPPRRYLCISMGSGTRCCGAAVQFSSAPLMPMVVIGDGHAEVLARRAAVAFLLDAVEALIAGGPGFHHPLIEWDTSQLAHKKHVLSSPHLRPTSASPASVEQQGHHHDSASAAIESCTSRLCAHALPWRWRAGVQLHLVVTQWPCGFMARSCAMETGSRLLLRTPLLSLRLLDHHRPCPSLSASKPAETMTTITSTATATTAVKVDEEKTEKQEPQQEKVTVVEQYHVLAAHRSAVDVSEAAALAARVKPGKGHPNLHMSCADKVWRWSVQGVQGRRRHGVLPPLLLASLHVGIPSANVTPQEREVLALHATAVMRRVRSERQHNMWEDPSCTNRPFKDDSVRKGTTEVSERAAVQPSSLAILPPPMTPQQHATGLPPPCIADPYGEEYPKHVQSDGLDTFVVEVFPLEVLSGDDPNGSSAGLNTHTGSAAAGVSAASTTDSAVTQGGKEDQRAKNAVKPATADSSYSRAMWLYQFQAEPVVCQAIEGRGMLAQTHTTTITAASSCSSRKRKREKEENENEEQAGEVVAEQKLEESIKGTGKTVGGPSPYSSVIGNTESSLSRATLHTLPIGSSTFNGFSWMPLPSSNPKATVHSLTLNSKSGLPQGYPLSALPSRYPELSSRTVEELKRQSEQRKPVGGPNGGASSSPVAPPHTAITTVSSISAGPVTADGSAERCRSSALPSQGEGVMSTEKDPEKCNDSSTTTCWPWISVVSSLDCRLKTTMAREFPLSRAWMAFRTEKLLITAHTMFPDLLCTRTTGSSVLQDGTSDTNVNTRVPLLPHMIHVREEHRQAWDIYHTAQQKVHGSTISSLHVSTAAQGARVDGNRVDLYPTATTSSLLWTLKPRAGDTLPSKSWITKVIHYKNNVN